MTTATRANTLETSLHVFVAEASDLGLPVGSWPRLIETDLGNGQSFVRSTKKVDADGDIQYVRYVQANGCIALKIFND